MKLRIGLLALLLHFTMIAAAQGALIKWELNAHLHVEAGTTGGVATGSFIFDTNTQMFSNIALVTPAGSRSGGLLFDEYRFHTNFFSGPQPFGGDINFGRSSTPTGTQIVFRMPVRLSGLMVAGILQWGGGRFAEFTCIPPNIEPNFPYCSQGSNVSNWGFAAPNTLTGTLLPSQVPLPAALPLFLAGLFGLSFAKLSRR